MSACPVDTVSAPVSSHSSGREFAVLWPVAKPRGLSLMVWYLMVVRSVACGLSRRITRAVCRDASPAGLRKNLQRKCGM